MPKANDKSAATAAAQSKQSDAVHEPGSDWVPLPVAPFHYFGECGFIRTDEEWRVAFSQLVESSIPDYPAPPLLPGENPHAWVEVEWAVKWRKRTPSIEAKNLALLVYPDSGAVSLRELVFGEGPRIFISEVDLDRFVGSELWKIRADEEPPPEEIRHVLRRYQELVPQWFLRLAAGLQFSMQSRLSDCVKEGAALIMARKNNVLAPFERVWPDQWDYFRVTHSPRERRLDDPWYNPTSSAFDDIAPVCTASGPNDEKLYSIHVAPGAPRVTQAKGRAEASPELSCSDFLIDAMTRTPDRPPGGTVTATRAKCLEMFGGLSGRGFDDAYSYAKKRFAEITGRECGWSTPGRKSLAQFPAVESSSEVIRALPPPRGR